MTQDPNRPDDSLALPEPEPISPPEVQRERKALVSPGVKYGTLIAGVFVVISGAIFWTTQKEMQPSKVVGAPSLDATPGGSVQAESPAYQEAVRKANERRAQLAAEYGVTSMPTPAQILKPVETPEPASIEKIDGTPKPAVEPEAPKPVVSERRILPAPPPVVRPSEVPVVPAAAPVAAPAEETENPFLQAMLTQMQSGATRFAPKPMQSGGLSGSSGVGQVEAAEDAADTTAAVDPMAPENLLLRPGDILYATTMTAVNSDMSAPVLAEVVAGPLKGARLTGSFEASLPAGRMVVQFQDMTHPDGRVFQVDAFAVDGKSAEMAVASDVEHRFVARYAPVLAATFISGYARSASQVSSTVTNIGDDSVVVDDTPSPRQSVMSGVSAAADAIAEDISASAPKGPKIKLASNYPIAIMFVKPVSEIAAPVMAAAPAVAGN
ncbi:hypothetical protein LAZ40_11535 [Cereibacter sphaeroides]|uniref:DotG/IcmE/VirB10 family protein n=1 Tax=Cereibacter sphaeroides TaxID=1063 RepID=UPI001F18E703|nr:DotG/IcmE/VirB10 family protein [Cereibacter sphaeroides]MCE6959650.1 hypothetical protein [Cereibacter sphaeroides]MCE6974489.1 hypothetical protein [Cereibacter sphaeroides]